MKIRCLAVSAIVVALCTSVATAQNKRDIAVRTDKQSLSNDDTWIYDDLDSAISAAERSKRPLMVVFR